MTPNVKDVLEQIRADQEAEAERAAQKHAAQQLLPDCDGESLIEALNNVHLRSRRIKNRSSFPVCDDLRGAALTIHVVEGKPSRTSGGGWSFREINITIREMRRINQSSSGRARVKVTCEHGRTLTFECTTGVLWRLIVDTDGPKSDRAAGHRSRGYGPDKSISR